jgi:hypothetical protein
MTEHPSSATCRHRANSIVGGVCDACARVLEQAVGRPPSHPAPEPEPKPAPDLEVVSAALRRQRAVQSTIEQSRQITRERKRKSQQESIRQSVMPMYEANYCEPAEIHGLTPTEVVGFLGGENRADPPLDEHPAQANELTSRAPEDIEYTIRVETGMRRVYWTRWHQRRAGVYADQLARESDDLPYRRRLDPEIDPHGYHFNADALRRIQTNRSNEDVFRDYYPTRQPARVLAVDATMLAWEFGLGTNAFLFEDGPRELTCSDDGHIDMPDRWNVYYKD